VSVHVTEQHLSRAQRLVERCRANDGLAPVEIDRFWEDDGRAWSDPFSEDCPQVPLGVRMSSECVFDELGVPEDWYRLTHDDEYRVALARRYNDRAQQIVGRRVLSEVMPDLALTWPTIKGLHDIFEAEQHWEGTSYWLMQSADAPDALAALLDRVEKRLENLRDFLLPENWDQARTRITAAGGKLPLYRKQRGPVTFAMSVYGVENLIFLIHDDPTLAARFRDLILKSVLERARIIDEEAGFTDQNYPHGFSWSDDNCAMLTAEMYDFFAFPILKGVFDHYSPNPNDTRGQHSDSDMAHLLPTLGKLKLTSVNFGPNLTVRQIRDHLPKAIIRGQLAPFTFSRNEEVNIVAEFLRDFEMAREQRGLVFRTAGSINNGSRLSGMRLIMAAIQEFGRYR